MNKFYMLTEIGGWWGVTPEMIQRFLNQNKGQDVEIIINSEGGYVSEGVAIYNLLKLHDGKVTTRAVGQVASIASVIFLAGEERIIETGAWLMIHKPWTIIGGDAEQLRKEAEVLDTLQETIENIYKEGFTGEDEELTALVDAETWLLGEEALAKGFATSTAEPINAVASSVRRNLSNFKNVPKALMGDRDTNSQPPAPAGINTKDASNSGPGDKPAAQNNNNTITEVTGMEIKDATAADLLKENPELFAEVQAKGTTAEQDRVAGIRALASVVEGSPAAVISAVNAKINTLCEDPKATAETAAKALLQTAANAQQEVEGSVGAGARALGDQLDEVPAHHEDNKQTEEAKAKNLVEGMAAGLKKK